MAEQNQKLTGLIQIWDEMNQQVIPSHTSQEMYRIDKLTDIIMHIKMQIKNKVPFLNEAELQTECFKFIFLFSYAYYINSNQSPNSCNSSINSIHGVHGNAGNDCIDSVNSVNMGINMNKNTKHVEEVLGLIVCACFKKLKLSIQQQALMLSNLHYFMPSLFLPSPATSALVNTNLDAYNTRIVAFFAGLFAHHQSPANLFTLVYKSPAKIEVCLHFYFAFFLCFFL